MRILAVCLIVAVVAGAGCAPLRPSPNHLSASIQTPAPQAVVNLVKRYRLTLTGSAVLSTATIPAALDAPQWALPFEVSERIGLPIARAAGARVVLSRFPIAQRYGIEPLYLLVVTRQGTVVGAYLTVRERSTLAPGVFALSDPGLSGLADVPSGRPNKRIERTP